MRILNFDNTRCCDLINKNMSTWRKMFWQEMTYLSAFFYCHAMNAYVQHKMKDGKNEYIGNIQKSMELSSEAMREVEELQDLMIGQITMQAVKDNAEKNNH